MVWTVAFNDSTKEQVLRVCKFKGLRRPHDPAIYVRRVLEQNLLSEIRSEEILFGND